MLGKAENAGKVLGKMLWFNKGQSGDGERCWPREDGEWRGSRNGYEQGEVLTAWEGVALDISSGCRRLAGPPGSAQLCTFPSGFQKESPALWCAKVGQSLPVMS